jgi:hypothetical protein
MSIVEDMKKLSKLVDMTDPWCGQKCVAPLVGKEARHARAAFFRMWRHIVGEKRHYDMDTET